MTVSVTLVRTLVEEIVRASADPAAFLASAGVDARLLDDPNARIELACYDRLHELALDTTGDPALGLHMAERATLSAFHVVGFMSVHCRTVREALEVFARYRRLLSDCEPPTLREEGDQAILTCHFLRGSERCSRLRAELVVTSLVKIAQGSLGMAHAPLVAEFEHAPPDYADEYARVLGCTVRFDGPATRLVFAQGALDAPRFHSNPELFRLLESQADRNLASVAAPHRLSTRVRDLVRAHRSGAMPTMQRVARTLGVSERSLRRRLHDEEGRTYADVVDEALAELARQLLHEGGATIQDVADRLGFSEASAFHRAFKRWTGLTPQQYRASRTAD